MKNRTLQKLLLVCVLALLATSCGGTTTDKIREAANPTATLQPVATTAATSAPKSTDTQKPTEPPKPTATSEAAKQKLNIQSVGFGQRERNVGFGFIVENPNPSYALENSQYQAAIYDAAGTVIKTESGYLQVVLPSQTLGVAGTAFLSEGAKAAKVEVQLNAKNYVASEALPTFTVEKIDYQDDKFTPKVTAVIKNPYKTDVDNLRVNVIAFDAAGKIVGGGFTYQNFILANGQTGTSVSVVADSKPAKVDVYPTLSSLSLLRSPKPPAEAKSAIITSQGFGQSARQVGYAFLVQNPNPNFSIESMEYQATAYAADGRVLSSNSGYVEVLLPNQQLGVGDSIYVPEGAQVKSLEVQVRSTKFTKSDALTTLTTEKVTYVADRFSPKVTGVVKSPYSKDVKNIRANAVAYDASGKIIGGGFTYIDFVPANGQAAVEISVKTSENPVKVEIYPVLSALSIFQ